MISVGGKSQEEVPELLLRVQEGLQPGKAERSQNLKNDRKDVDRRRRTVDNRYTKRRNDRHPRIQRQNRKQIS